MNFAGLTWSFVTVLLDLYVHTVLICLNKTEFQTDQCRSVAVATVATDIAMKYN